MKLKEILSSLQAPTLVGFLLGLVVVTWVGPDTTGGMILLLVVSVALVHLLVHGARATRFLFGKLRGRRA